MVINHLALTPTRSKLPGGCDVRTRKTHLDGLVVVVDRSCGSLLSLERSRARPDALLCIRSRVSARDSGRGARCGTENQRKRARVEALERVEDVVGPKEIGREGMLEKKRAQREADRASRDKGDDGFEADERTLLGGGDSFKEQCVPFTPPVCRHCGTHTADVVCFVRVARRDAARRRFEGKRGARREEMMSVARERTNAMREKDKAAMDMFQQLAMQRFG